jgi:hypothetical protein
MLNPAALLVYSYEPIFDQQYQRISMSASLSISHISKQLVRFRTSVPAGVTFD